MLPNLLVIGAGKAGTTSLHYYLGMHPEIAMSRVKEANFWHLPDWRARLDWYESLFDPNARLRGESCPSYTVHPVAPGVPRRIREVIPDVKLIYLVRDPVARFVAHYSQHLVNSKEDRTLSEAVESALNGGDAPHGYLAASSYGAQLEQYLEHFPPASLHVIDNVDLKERRRETLQDAFAFLGADPGFDTERFDHVLNEEKDQVRFGKLGRRIRKSRPARAMRAYVPYEVRRPVTSRIRRLMAEPVVRPELGDDERRALESRLKPEADRLRELTGKPFPAWSV